MNVYDALPSELYEILNCAIATTCAMALVICLRYLVVEFVHTRTLFRYKLALGFTVFLFGEAPRMTWVWLARFLSNTHHDSAWMGELPWVLVPIVGSAVSVAGMALIIRALAPEVWGRWGYLGALGLATAAVIGTQIFR